MWNVGQGSWSTLVNSKTCHHFDMGGDFSPLERVKKLCKNKENKLYISHMDWDHISFISQSLRDLSSFCLAHQARRNLKKDRYLQKLKVCSKKNDEAVRKVFTPQSHKLTENESSHIFIANDIFLVPGDSTSKMEKKWIRKIDNSLRIKTLILGHHGSLTSTSQALLQRLPNLKVAIASARKKKYGHPHIKVVQRLRQRRISLIKTEVWGHLIFEL